MGGVIERNARQADIAEMFTAAEKLPPGRKREKLLRDAENLEITAKVESWINSLGLRSPTESADRRCKGNNR